MAGPAPRAPAPVVAVVMGPAGVGKSAVGRAMAERLGVPFLDGDDVHSEANRAKIARGEPLTDADRAPWLAELADRLADAGRRRTGVVLACSALKRAYREVLSGGWPGTVYVHLRADPAVIESRLTQRKDHFAGSSILPSQLEALEPPQPPERVVDVDAGRPMDEVVDRAVAQLADGSPGERPG
jgi:carbohydrate kinase (thermoresistant glucokinase family)